MAAQPVGRTLSNLGSALTAADLAHAAEQLSRRDRRLAGIYHEHGAPPLWPRPVGFATLLRIVLEQQVSLDSAAAAYRRLQNVVGEVTPHAFLELDDDHLKRIGFSRQKAGYGRGIATGVLDGSIDIPGLAGLDDESARQSLVQIKGIGSWSADVYLLFALLRPDVWPNGDRALVLAMAENLGLDDVPSYEEAAARSAVWRPWRSVAARMLWNAYLARRGRIWA
jgi:DNA-3-methyladenine glycosylase II